MNWQIIAGIIFLIGGIGNIFDSIGTFLICTPIGFVLLYFGLRKKGFFKSITKEEEDRTLKEETFYGAGVSYYARNIQKLACENPDWKLTSKRAVEIGKEGKRIFRYSYVNRPVKLQPEPDNEHDKNAIAIFIAGELVGYISRADNVHVKGILQKHEIKSISGFIGGGDYKVIEDDGTISKDSTEIGVSVRIKYI